MVLKPLVKSRMVQYYLTLKLLTNIINRNALNRKLVNKYSEDKEGENECVDLEINTILGNDLNHSCRPVIALGRSLKRFIAPRTRVVF